MNRNFNEIYQEIYANGIEDLTKLKNNRDISRVIFFISIFFLMLLYIQFSNFVLLAICLVINIIAILYLKKNDKAYREGFKHLVIAKMINLYNPEIKFYPNLGISEYDYRNSLFDNSYDNFKSEDLIELIIQDKYSFRMSQVCIEREETYTDNEGDRQERTDILFNGFFGIVDIEDNMLMKLDITSKNFFKKYSKSKIESESIKFEEKYDVFSNEKVRAMDIVTSDIMDEFNKFYEDTGYVMEIKVHSDKLYFRISCGDCFETPLLKEALGFEHLYKNFRLIDFPIDIISRMLKNAIETRK